MAIKGELFSGDMVQAFLENRKFRTSRPIKPKYGNTHFEYRTNKYGTEFIEKQNDVEGETWGKNSDGSTWHKFLGCIMPQPKFQRGDVIYVRETFYQYGEWHNIKKRIQINEEWKTVVKRTFIAKQGFPIYFKDTLPDDIKIKHAYKDGLGYYKRPSLFMPHEAARLSFKVTDVKVQRLEDMTEQDAVQDGFMSDFEEIINGGLIVKSERITALQHFKDFWWQQYGPDSHWMWVYYLTPTEPIR